MKKRISYWNRIFKAYLVPSTSQLSFWHGKPEINDFADYSSPREYYMKFYYKANYREHLDSNGIPRLNYHGKIGLQYNPIAISQYALGNYNLYVQTKDKARLKNFLNASNWLVDNLEVNSFNLKVWNHHFDFEYRDTLISPWYSGLAQGLGISVLVRAYYETKEKKYYNSSRDAWKSMITTIDQGGVLYIDSESNYWIEEYIVDPPTHILNGFIWALWGVYDYYKFMNNNYAKDLFDKLSCSLENNLYKYDYKFWSLYEESGTFLPMIASPFYHKLHIVQLKIMYKMSSLSKFNDYSKIWDSYLQNKMYKTKAILYKSIFKIFYY